MLALEGDLLEALHLALALDAGGMVWRQVCDQRAYPVSDLKREVRRGCAHQLAYVLDGRLAPEALRVLVLAHRAGTLPGRARLPLRLRLGLRLRLRRRGLLGRGRLLGCRGRRGRRGRSGGPAVDRHQLGDLVDARLDLGGQHAAVAEDPDTVVDGLARIAVLETGL